MSRPWRTASALVFVDDPECPDLAPSDAHHLARVLRLRRGDDVCAADGAGSWRIHTFDGTGALSPSDSAAGDTGGFEPPPAPTLTVGLALVKGEKPELVVQKLTEIGIDRIVLFRARRSVTRWDAEKVERNLERLRRIAVSACSQSRRLHIPEIESAEMSELMARGAVVADFGGRHLERDDRLVLIGPEGGWEQGEYGETPTVDLGCHVMRAETAALSAGVQMCTIRRLGSSTYGTVVG